MSRHAILCVLTAWVSLFANPSIKGQPLQRAKSPGPPKASFVADPDVRLTYDGNVAHMEAYMVASATNANSLVVGGEMLVAGRPLRTTETRLYHSQDAGATWTPVLLPTESKGGWDNAVATGPQGDFYFLTNNFNQGLTLYRSSDDGQTWQSTVLPDAKGWDRPHMNVDHSNGPYRGRIYIAGETEKGVSLVSSFDRGQTFDPTVVACPPSNGWNMATTASPMILSDGTLILSCAPYPNFPARQSWRNAEIGLVRSTDGGKRFTPYRPALTLHRALPQDYYPARARSDVLLTGNFMPGPSFAVAPVGSPYTDRLFASWQDIDSTGQSRLLFSWSADRGLTWSSAQHVDTHPLPGQIGADLRQGVPMLGVNQSGIVGLAWFDGRHAVAHEGYDVYFTGSFDGGLTFQPALRLSSQTSQPAQSRVNTLPSFLVGEPSPKGERILSLSSPFNLRSTGSDYATLTVDAVGRFHVLWPDARDNQAWQLYTSTVRVLEAKILQALLEKQKKTAQSRNQPPCLLDRTIQLRLGEPRWEANEHQISVPVQLVNISSDTLVHPITVSVYGASLSSARARQFVSNVGLPTFYDTARQAWGDTTALNYPLSAQAPLFPNGVSMSQTLRLQIDAPEWMDFMFRSTITTTGCPPAK